LATVIIESISIIFFIVSIFKKGVSTLSKKILSAFSFSNIVLIAIVGAKVSPLSSIKFALKLNLLRVYALKSIKAMKEREAYSKKYDQKNN